MSKPRTEAGRRLLDALLYRGITRLDDGFYEDKAPLDAILAIESEATIPAHDSLADLMKEMVERWPDAEWADAARDALRQCGAEDDAALPPLDEVRQGLVGIGNMARLAWTSPETVREAFQWIESTARDLAARLSATQEERESGT